MDNIIKLYIYIYYGKQVEIIYSMQHEETRLSVVICCDL
jgi:hypothetical protein